MYLARSAANSTQDLHQTIDVIAHPPRTALVRRWDGNHRTVIKWDSIRKVRSLDGKLYDTPADSGLGSRTMVLKWRLPDSFL